MPIYEYVGVTGERMLLRCPVAERNMLVYDTNGRVMQRQEIPSRLAVIGMKPKRTQGDDVLKGYYRKECEQGSRFKSEFSKKQIKEIWGQ